MLILKGLCSSITGGVFTLGVFTGILRGLVHLLLIHFSTTQRAGLIEIESMAASYVHVGLLSSKRYGFILYLQEK